MVVPAAMDIEMAVDSLPKIDERVLADQARELHCAVGDTTPDFVGGYQLGIQTARLMLAGSAELAMHGADPKNVL